MKKIYINESQINKELLLPKFLFDAVVKHETSLGDNPAFPEEDDYPFDYTVLKEGFKDLLAVLQSQHTIVQDRSIFEGVYVFVTNNYERGDLSERDYETYMELFGHMKRMMKLPDLMIYLRSSVAHLVDNIHKRGRDYEQTIPLKYLSNLNERYEEFVMKTYQGRKLVIDVDDMDYKNNPEDFAAIIDKIDGTLFGIFGPLD